MSSTVVWLRAHIVVGQFLAVSEATVVPQEPPPSKPTLRGFIFFDFSVFKFILLNNLTKISVQLRCAQLIHSELFAMLCIAKSSEFNFVLLLRIVTNEFDWDFVMELYLENK